MFGILFQRQYRFRYRHSTIHAYIEKVDNQKILEEIHLVVEIKRNQEIDYIDYIDYIGILCDSGKKK